MKRLLFPEGWTEITRPRLSSLSLTHCPVCDSPNRMRQRKPIFCAGGKYNLSQGSCIKNNGTARFSPWAGVCTYFWLLAFDSCVCVDRWYQHWWWEVHSQRGIAVFFMYFFFPQAVALMIYIIGLSVCGVWSQHCLITAGLHVHPSARGASITLRTPLIHRMM